MLIGDTVFFVRPFFCLGFQNDMSITQHVDSLRIYSKEKRHGIVFGVHFVDEVNFGGCFWGSTFLFQEPWACWRGDNFILLMKGCWEGSGTSDSSFGKIQFGGFWDS